LLHNSGTLKNPKIKFFDTVPGRLLLIAAAVYVPIFIGAIIFMGMEGLSYADALYFSAVTSTAVGCEST